MCGIFGLVLTEDASMSVDMLRKTTDLLFRLSESRGKEGAGIAIKDSRSIFVCKEPMAASRLIRSTGYQEMFDLIGRKAGKKFHDIQTPMSAIGHSRLVTSGRQEDNQNNQPVIKEGAVGVHNGIIVNDEQLWNQYPSLAREYEVDTEILLGLVQLFYKKYGSLVDATRKTFKMIEGSASVAVLFDRINSLVIATNTGSLYMCMDEYKKYLIFASEKYILERFSKARFIREHFSQHTIGQVMPFQAAIIDPKNLNLHRFDLKGFRPSDAHDAEQSAETGSITKVIDFSRDVGTGNGASHEGTCCLDNDTKDKMLNVCENLYLNSALKRCSKCILPETMPFIEFDESGVCNYCRTQQVVSEEGEKALEAHVAKYRSKSGEPDCIVSFSGGRDSTYALHYVKRVLKMNPIAYTYDWGVLTDLGRRNQARICGKLGVEHIIISADIERKRRYVKKNLMAWLEKPDMGMIPLLMAGDKQLLYYFYKLARITGIKLLFQASAGVLENSLFKIGFAGVKLDQSSINQQNISWKNKIKLALYYGKNYLTNTGYINNSTFDTLHAYYSNILLPEKYTLLYDYIQWNEGKIVRTIIDEYGWETDPGTKSTWRIDDGTTPFYNYIYMTVAGLTEHDTFRSNQIRQGMIDRGKALELIKEENKPRFDAIEWYARTIGFDVSAAIAVINSIPKLYVT